MKTIAVVGLGYIGLPLALSFCEKGFRVMGVDVDERKVDGLKKGLTNVAEAYNGETLESMLKRHLAQGNFTPTTSVADVAKEVSAYIVTVGMPVESNGQVTRGPLIAAMENLGRVLKKGDLVLVRSTVVPGTMEEQVIPLLEKGSNMQGGVDFHVAYAAERVAEGRALYEFQTLDVVCAGLTEACGKAAADLLGSLTSGTVHVTDMRTAEMSKVIENVQRDVNIALAQEFKALADYHGVNVFELIRLANTHPRVRLLEPNIGVGGYCIPNAWPYLKASLPQGDTLPLLQLARDINTDAPRLNVERLGQDLAERGKTLAGSTVAVLGLGMKDGSNDTRFSPAVMVADQLVAKGAKVRAYDPTCEIQFSFQVATLEECLSEADAVVVGAWQSEFEEMPLKEALRLGHQPLCVLDLKGRLRPYLPALSFDAQSQEEGDNARYVGASQGEE